MNIFENAFYIGIGLAMKGKEKIEEAADAFVANSKMSAEDGKKFVDEMVTSAEKTKEEFTRKVEEIVGRTLSDAGAAKKGELEALKARVGELEAEIRALKEKN